MHALFSLNRRSASISRDYIRLYTEVQKLGSCRWRFMLEQMVLLGFAPQTGMMQQKLSLN